MTLRVGRWTVGIVVAFFAAFGVSFARGADDAKLRSEVLGSIRRAQTFLFDQQNGDGSWSSSSSILEFRNGTTGLVVLALLNSGLSENEEHVAKGLKYLRTLPAEQLEGSSNHKPYELSLMLQALAAVKGRDTGRIKQLAELLVAYQRPNGGWRYEREGDDWDNSVTQFAILGLREAAMNNVPIDNAVWERTQNLMLGSVIGDINSPVGAGWSYTPEGANGVYGSMTVAGMSSLLISSTMLQLDKDVFPDGRIDCCGNGDDERVRKTLAAGERWMARKFSVQDNPDRSGYAVFYYLYGLERVGRLSGIRFFGEHDWYRAGANFLVKAQNTRTGGWHQQGGVFAFPTVDTAYALLFLSKGLAPVVVNKIKFGPRDNTGEVKGIDWNRHPRDVANLVDAMTARTGWPAYLNWQIIDLQQAVKGEGVEALLQAPVQFLSGTDDPAAIDGPQLDLLREYIMQGGFLFAMQNCENKDFDAGFRALIARMFPTGEYKLQKLPPTHDIYRSEAVFTNNPPELYGVDFGCRTAIVYAPFDHACRWQKWTRADVRGRKPEVKSQIAQSMNLGINVIAYATNRELVNKLDRPPALAAEKDQLNQRSTIEIARLRHTGGWDVAPNALRHLQASLEKLGYKMLTTSPNLPATDIALRDYPIAYMHGRKNFSFTQEERDGLRGYLENGGTLIADASCGSPQFDASFREMIAQAFGKQLERIPVTDELYNLAKLGHDIRRVKRRIPTEGASGALATEESEGEPVLEGLKLGERYVILYSRYDLSCALEQQNTQACAGYSRLDAARIAANLVIYALAQ